jgi:hypothetical protein
VPEDVLDPDDELESELAELRALGDRLGAEPVVWEDPPEDLWASIRSALDGDVADVTEPSRPALTALPGGAPDAGPTGVRGTARRRGPGRLPLLVLAAAAVVAVLVGLLAVMGGDDDPGAVVAAAPLDLLEGPGEGRAELVERDGRYELHLAASGVEPDDGFLEVWVIDTEVEGMFSLGPVRADGVYDLPPGVDPRAFPIVDVSVEPLDGVPTHSGASVLRGQLTF